MSVYSVRNSKDLRDFLSHPLISNKARELQTFSIYLDLLSSNEHVGNSLKARDQFLKLALVLKELNAKRLLGHKSDRLFIPYQEVNKLSTV